MKRGILRKISLVISLFVLVFISVSSSWAAEKYPTRNIELVVGFPPGGMSDIINRFWAKYLEKYLGVTVVPVNKPGGGGVVGTTYVVNSRPDGYTMGNFADSMVISILMGQATYSVEDLRVVAQIAYSSHLMAVNAESPWKTFQEFMDYARKNPGLKYGHQGIGSMPHIRMENLNKQANLKMISVPFNGDAETIPALIGKHITTGIFGAMTAKAQADAGKMRILLSFDPTAELGLDPSIADFDTFFGRSIPNIDTSSYLVVAKKTPPDILQTIERGAEKMTKDPEYIGELKKLYMRPAFIDGNTVMQKKLPEKMALIKAILQSSGAVK
jgi:tripartite-type tricarboxylate transporter receptor subunit TctC